MRFPTLAIHAGQEPAEGEFGAVTPPLYLTSTFRQEAPGEHQGYDYSRATNPTRQVYETCLAALESALAGVAFASGMAAIDAVLRLMPPDAQVLCVADVYGGTYRLFHRLHEVRGLRFDYVSAAELNADPARHLAGKHLVWLETPTNPLLSIVDLEAVSAAVNARSPKPLLAVDNTFASPYLQRPLELGADFAVHSTSKYVGGHADLIGGFVAVNDPVLAERLRFLQLAAGAVPSPFDCWLALRGLKTLALRMERQSENALTLASELERHPKVRQVLYPGLPRHPGHEVAARQMNGRFGAMVSLLLESEAAALTLCERTELFTLAESLGGVESLIEHPQRMTHYSSQTSPFPVPPELVRLSVGAEAVEDLWEDLRRALG